MTYTESYWIEKLIEPVEIARPRGVIMLALSLYRVVMRLMQQVGRRVGKSIGTWGFKLGVAEIRDLL